MEKKQTISEYSSKLEEQGNKLSNQIKKVK
jgi:hypothetical protein